MKVPAPSTIAQVLYPNEMALDFARIVSELDLVLSRLRGGDAVHVGWDCDDLVTFDIADTRILLACIDYGTYDRKACLMVSVGPRDVFAVKTVGAGTTR